MSKVGFSMFFFVLLLFVVANVAGCPQELDEAIGRSVSVAEVSTPVVWPLPTAARFVCGLMPAALRNRGAHVLFTCASKHSGC